MSEPGLTDPEIQEIVKACWTGAGWTEGDPASAIALEPTMIDAMPAEQSDH